MPERCGALSQALPYRPNLHLRHGQRRGGLRDPSGMGQVRLATWEQRNRRVCIGEKAAIAGVQITLGRQACREQHGMAIKLDMEILDRPQALLLRDRASVQKQAHGDEHTAPQIGWLDKDRMIRREP